MSHVNYSINNFKVSADSSEKYLKNPLELKNQACFSTLSGKTVYLYKYGKNETIRCGGNNFYQSFNPGGHIIYHASNKLKKINREETTSWYSKILNNFGLNHELLEIGATTEFKVFYENSRIKMLATLCALRYLDEQPFPSIIEFFWKNKDWAGDDLEKIFQLFQLSHFAFDPDKKNYPNSNHSFVPGWPGGYGGGGNASNHQKIYSLENFQKNINNTKKNFLNGVFREFDVAHFSYATLPSEKLPIFKYLSFGEEKVRFERIGEIVDLLKG